MCHPYIESDTALSDIYMFVVQKKLDCTLVIDSPFQIFAIELLIKFFTTTAFSRNAFLIE